MITQNDIDAVASPPLTEEQLARLKPAREFLGEEKLARLKVYSGSGQSVQAASGELCDRIKALIYEYEGRLPLAAGIGVLEIAKLEIIEEHKAA
jgi:hypothetical protein